MIASEVKVGTKIKVNIAEEGKRKKFAEGKVKEVGFVNHPTQLVFRVRIGKEDWWSDWFAPTDKI